MSRVMMGLGVTGPNATDNVNRLELGKGFFCIIIKDLNSYLVSAMTLVTQYSWEIFWTPAEVFFLVPWYFY